MFVPLETSSREFGPPVKTLPRQKDGGESTLQRLPLIRAFAQIDKRKSVTKNKTRLDALLQQLPTNAM
ncbi:hypothetical protein PI124_g9478 [Phytophthora idaei]|nr:hypothetical protein PI125_g8700 [Phytophthora idaei]KAG3157033.1 hypothetical protein PI126_g8496 [Phytophthora idaei]KAG3245799.1 hypothetical protein PI124_g9478 [Phytophthora idaei]